MLTRTAMHDDSLSLLVHGYDFGARMWRRAERGARAVPIVQRTLFGQGSVHSLDGAEHRHRKATFVDVAYEDPQVQRLIPQLEREWQTELDSWLAGGKRAAYEAAVGAFGRAGMRWAPLPGTPAAQTRWAARLAQIVDGFGAPYSPEYLLAAANRRWSDRHAQRLIEAVRGGALGAASAGTALHACAWHRDSHGRLLDARLAGIELQNSIRPLIAVARFVAFAARSSTSDRSNGRRLPTKPRSGGLVHASVASPRCPFR